MSEQGEFVGVAGGPIRWQAWSDEAAETRGVVVLAHGLGEHGGRYEHVARRLSAAGFPFYAADHRGHGRSAGRRANIDSMDAVVADLDTMIVTVQGRHPGRPLFLYGHSMGGLIALQYASGNQSRLTGLIVTGPAVDIAGGTPIPLAVAKVVSRLAPNLGAVALDENAVSRDPAVVAAYHADPLVHHGKVPVRSGTEMLSTAAALPARLGRITVPVLVLQGDQDRLVGPAGARLVAERVGSSDVTLRMYEGLAHEVHNEPEQQMVLDDMLGWLQSHC